MNLKASRDFDGSSDVTVLHKFLSTLLKHHVEGRPGGTPAGDAVSMVTLVGSSLARADLGVTCMPAAPPRAIVA